MATPLSIIVEIAGVDRTDMVKGLSYTKTTNGIGTASFTVVDPTGAYFPDYDVLVEITINSALEWAGEIASMRATYLGEHGGLSTAVTAHDWNQLAQRVLVNTGYPSQTLKDTLEELTNTGGVLDDVGVGLDLLQAAGPTLEVITAPWMQVDDLLNEISQRSAYVWRIDAFKTLKMWPIGAHASLVTISLANGNLIDAEWTHHRHDYRNTRWLVYGPSGVQSVTDAFDGDGVATDFQLHYYVHTPPALGYVLPGTGGDPLVPDPVPIGVYGVDTGWTYNVADQGIYQDPLDTPLTGSQSIAFIYDSDFPNVVSVQDAGEVSARGLWVAASAETKITTYAEAVAHADALLRESIPRVQIGRVKSTAYTIRAGDTVIIDLPEIQFDVECYVLSATVHCADAGTNTVPYIDLELAEGTERQRTAWEYWARILKAPPAPQAPMV